MPFPQVTMLSELVSGSMFYDQKFPSAEELLGELPAIFSDIDVETFVESYHDAYKADARELFDEIVQFIQRASALAEQPPDAEGAAWELVLLRLIKSGLVGSLTRLNERENDLRTLQALPTNDMAH